MSCASVDGTAVVDEDPGRLHGGGGQPGGALHAAARELAGGGPGAAPVPRPARSLQTIIRCYTITLYPGQPYPEREVQGALGRGALKLYLVVDYFVS